MKLNLTTAAVLAALGSLAAGCSSGGGSSSAAIKSVEFVATSGSPTTAADMATTHTTAKAVVTYSDGTTKDFPLAYNVLFGVKDKVGGNANPAGQLYDYQMNPLLDPFGQPLIAETPDSNSLLNIGGKLFLVTHLEYDWLLSDGSESYSYANWYLRAPTGMLLSELTQASNGTLSVKTQRPIDFSSVNGTWINCFGSQTPWNTHLGSEEDYDLQYNPLNSNYATTAGGIKAMTELYWKNTKTANPYHYGILPEVTISSSGATSIVKHYAMGRGTWEMGKVMPDERTAYMGDDGAYGLMTMFVADKAKDLTAGTVYAAKWNQTSSENGGAANLTWVKLGHATDAEIKALVDGGITFTDIFDAVAASNNTCAAGYTRIRAGSASDECLKVKTGMEKAAAFLETRRYAALMGATTEFTKMEGITVNAKDKKAYMAISYIQTSMKAETAAPVDHIQVPENKAGATYTIELGSSQKDTTGTAINSEWVGTRMYVESALLGKMITTDAVGNTADPDRVANTDNVFFSEGMRTLFIGEDSGTHVNNYVWAYNVDTKKLTRIMSLVSGAESTGLQVIDDLNGHAYIMSNGQHQGEFIGTMNATLKTELSSKIDRLQAPVGYIGGLPAIK